MSMTARGVGGWLFLLAVSSVVSVSLTGCGGDAPPPAPSAAEFEAATQKRDEIIKKEYGGAAAPAPASKK